MKDKIMWAVYCNGVLAESFEHYGFAADLFARLTREGWVNVKLKRERVENEANVTA